MNDVPQINQIKTQADPDQYRDNLKHDNKR